MEAWEANSYKDVIGDIIAKLPKDDKSEKQGPSKRSNETEIETQNGTS